MPHGASGKIISNTFFNAAGRVWGILTGLVLTPYILGRVGIERYGVWAIAGVITGYFNLLDLGMGASYVKFISGYYARDDREGINRVVNTGLFVYLGLAALFIPLSFAAAGPLLKLFNIPGELYGEALFVLRAGLGLFFVSNAVSVFGAVPQGLQRMDVSNKISVGVSIPLLLGSVYALENGFGLRGLMVNNAVVLLLAAAANALWCVKLLPGFRISPRYFSKETFRVMFAFGYKLQFSKVAEVVVFQTDRLLLGYFAGVSSAGIYQIGSSLVQQARQLPLLLVSAVLPAASDMDARDEREKLRELYLRGSKYLLSVAVPFFLFLIAVADLIVGIWVGPGYRDSALVVRILAAGYLANLLAGVGTSVAAAVGRPEFQMGAAAISAASNIVLSVVLTRAFGYTGAAAAASAALMFGPVYFFLKLHARLGLSTGALLRGLVLVPLAASVLGVALVSGGNALAGEVLGRGTMVMLLLADAGVFIFVYSFIVLRSGWLDAYDMSVLRKLAAPRAFFRGGGA